VEFVSPSPSVFMLWVSPFGTNFRSTSDPSFFFSLKCRATPPQRSFLLFFFSPSLPAQEKFTGNPCCFRFSPPPPVGDLRLSPQTFSISLPVHERRFRLSLGHDVVPIFTNPFSFLRKVIPVLPPPAGGEVVSPLFGSLRLLVAQFVGFYFFLSPLCIFLHQS